MSAVALYDVFGMCNPLYDLHVEATDELIAELGVEKGGMFLVSHEQQRAMVPHIYDRIVAASPGGSGANTMIGVAQVGGRAVFTGHAGKDEHYRLYREGLEARGIRANIGSSEGDTGICVVLLTPDTERTMLTYLGRSTSLSRGDIDVRDLEASKYLYVTAYLWDTDTQKEAVLFAMSEANRLGVKVCLNLSDPFCVNRHKEELLSLIRGHVDVVIGNAVEVAHITDCEAPSDGARKLAEHSETVAVTCDTRGSIIFQDGAAHAIAAYRVEAVDATGAGDAYAAGLLHGLAIGLPLDKAGRIASYIAAQVVAQVGPRLEAVDRHLLASL
jgi:sugar/nucleoside kinase (ribokinase family)